MRLGVRAQRYLKLTSPKAIELASAVNLESKTMSIFVRLAILSCTFLLPVTTYANAVSPEDFQIVEVYNQYYLSIRSAELCNKQPFKDTKEQLRFEKDFTNVRREATKALKRNKPNFQMPTW
jgi:hypothetical protein